MGDEQSRRIVLGVHLFEEGVAHPSGPLGVVFVFLGPDLKGVEDFDDETFLGAVLLDADEILVVARGLLVIDEQNDRVAAPVHEDIEKGHRLGGEGTGQKVIPSLDYFVLHISRPPSLIPRLR